MKQPKNILTRTSTNILRLAVLTIGGIVSAAAVYLLPALIAEDDTPFVLTLLLLYLTTIPFYTALFKALELLSLIDKNKAFSHTTIAALSVIKKCALTFGGIYAIMPLFLYPIAQSDDAPGLMVFPLFIAFAAFVVGTAVAVMERLLREAIRMKSENDLTV